jgi:glycosyltransferase involved in cell wall biosynthesis
VAPLLLARFVASPPESTSRRRVLIFVVAYEAESTLEKVLARIPPRIRDLAVEVLVIDDSSRDHTFEVGVTSSGHSHHPVTVLYNRENQGYGGNQKLGYAYAVRHQFDFVVLLHGDAQYPPERIPDLLEPLLDGAADAVLGSRMLTRGGARAGGMPLYKWVGNRVLTRVQNALLGSALSEFHSGFRAYRVSTLARLPVQYNANDFHFDTEIIIQLMLTGSRIAEIPIPTHYGEELCRVDGLRYARDVVRTTLNSRLHRLGLLFDRKFDVEGPGNAHYRLKLGYPSSHTMTLDAVPAGARVLDIGCGPGSFARELARKGCRVVGVDRVQPEDADAFERFLIADPQQPPAVDVRTFDRILLLDVVEHLSEPERILDWLRQASRSLNREPAVVVTTGNVAFCIVRLQLLFGNFNYGKRGILDLTHRRLYTFRTLRALFEQCGFRVERMAGVPAPFPEALGPTVLARGLLWINRLLIAVARGLFSYQIFMVATPTPTVEAFLDDTLATSQAKAEGAPRPKSAEAGSR